MRLITVVVGYGEIGQARRAAWHRKEHLADVTEADLDAQMARVAALLDRAFPTTPNDANLSPTL